MAPEDLDGLERAAVAAAAALERGIMTLAKKFARRRPDMSGFMKAAAKLIGAGLVRINRRVQEAIRKAIRIGQTAGRDEAATISRLRRTAPRLPENRRTGVTIRTPQEVTEELKELAPAMMESARGMYADILRRTLANPPRSEADRLRIAQDSLDDFSKRGVTGFVDKSGRRWNMVSYVEMATRTAAANIARDAHAYALVSAGYDVVRVTTAPNCAPRCQPYQGRLLSLTGATTGMYGGERVVASMAEAVANGHRGPNCRHVFHLWVPGDDMPEPPRADPTAYEQSQELRRLERSKRQAKRVEASAVTPQAQTNARARVAAADAALEAFANGVGLERKPEREVPDLVL